MDPHLGDGQMVARVLSQDATDNWAKAGIMQRDTLADNATNVFLALIPHHSVTFQWRGATNAQSTIQPRLPVTASTWLKLVRHNSTIGFVSGDGMMWTTVGAVTLTMGATSSIGLAVTAPQQPDTQPISLYPREAYARLGNASLDGHTRLWSGGKFHHQDQ